MAPTILCAAERRESQVLSKTTRQAAAANKKAAPINAVRLMMARAGVDGGRTPAPATL